VNTSNFKYIYGPVPSWRLGSSLGVDPLSKKKKVCTFDCIYCQLGKTKNFTRERKVFVSSHDVIKEIKSLPPIKIDYITFSGTGEPTIARNLSSMISSVKIIRNEKIAILTNSSLMDRVEARSALLHVDFVIAKLDACSEDSLKLINRPMPGITFDAIVNGIKEFSAEYTGKLALQIMFIDKNKDKAEELADLAREIGPYEVQINTPLRSCGVKPLPNEELLEIKEYFKNLNPICVYEASHKEIFAISTEDTLRRRGKI